MELCLQDGLSCNAVAARLGLLSSSLAHWVYQDRIDRGEAGPLNQGLLNNEERAELSRLRNEMRVLRMENEFILLAAAHLPKEQLPQRVFA